MADKSFLLSGLFEVIGPGKTSFKVHQDLLARKSKVLGKAVNGKMRESETKTIFIKAIDDDIDDDTVMRFLESVYTGDYDVPDPVDTRLTSAEEAAEATSGSLSDNHDETQKRTQSRKEAKSTIPPLKRSPLFYLDLPDEDLGNSGLATHRPLLTYTHFFEDTQTASVPPWKNQPYEDFTSVFLCHARLYKFSDRYDCPGLMQLSLRRLDLALSQHIFYPKRKAGIIELIRYTYLHTMDMAEGCDKLRKAVLGYVGSNIQSLVKEKSFLDLLKEPGSLASDLMTSLAPLIK